MGFSSKQRTMVLLICGGCAYSKIEKDDKSPGEESDISDDDTGKRWWKIWDTNIGTIFLDLGR